MSNNKPKSCVSHLNWRGVEIEILYLCFQMYAVGDRRSYGAGFNAAFEI